MAKENNIEAYNEEIYNEMNKANIVNESLTVNKQAAQDLSDKNPSGIDYSKVPEPLRAQTVKFLTDKKLLISNIQEVIQKGSSNPNYTEAVEARQVAEDQIMTLSNSMDQMAAMQKNVADRYINDEVGMKKSMTRKQQLNFHLLMNGNYGANGLNSQLLEDGNWMHGDAMGAMVKAIDLDVGSPYDSSLQTKIQEDFDLSAKSGAGINSGTWLNVEMPSMVQEMENLVNNNPNKIRDLVFQMNEFKPLVDELISSKSGIPMFSNGKTNPDWEKLTQSQELMVKNGVLMPTYEMFKEKLKSANDWESVEGFMSDYKEMIINKFNDGLSTQENKVANPLENVESLDDLNKEVKQSELAKELIAKYSK